MWIHFFFLSTDCFCSYDETSPLQHCLNFLLSLIWFYTESSHPSHDSSVKSFTFKPSYIWKSTEPIKEGFSIDKSSIHSCNVTGAGCQYNWMSVILLQWETCTPIKTAGYVSHLSCQIELFNVVIPVFPFNKTSAAQVLIYWGLQKSSDGAHYVNVKINTLQPSKAKSTFH